MSYAADVGEDRLLVAATGLAALVVAGVLPALLIPAFHRRLRRREGEALVATAKFARAEERTVAPR